MEQEMLGALGYIILPVLLLTAGLAGWYMSLRIGANELAWIAGTIMVASVLSALMLLAVSFDQPFEVGEVLTGVILLSALSLGAAWLGRFLAKRREDVSTVAYLARLLDHDDGVAMIDLVAKAAEQEPIPQSDQPHAVPNPLCTSCGSAVEAGTRFCNNCRAVNKVARLARSTVEAHRFGRGRYTRSPRCGAGVTPRLFLCLRPT